MTDASGASSLLRRDLAAELTRLAGTPGHAHGLAPGDRDALLGGRPDALSLDVLVDALGRAGHAVRLEAGEVEAAEADVNLHALFHATATGFCVIEMVYDAADEAVDYRFVEANSAFETHTGLIDAVGRTAYELVPNLEPRWVATYDAVARSGERTWFKQGSATMGRVFEVEALRVGPPTDRRVALLFTDVTDRVRAQEALRDANDTLEQQVLQRTAEVRALARALTLAEQEVRRRIAYVLHDDLQQVLHGVQIAAQVGDADRLDTLLDRSLAITRRLADELSPPLLRDSGLAPLMRWLADSQSGLDVDVDIPESVAVPEEHLRILLYQIVRELLFNIAKHAQTRSAQIRAESLDGTVRITVEDDGVGFDPPSIEQLRQGNGLGLTSVWDRLALVGGALSIESAPGAGARLILEVPMGREAAEALG